MPYIPSNVDVLSVPNWDVVHPDLHKRYISTKPDKLRGHTWDFGTGGYIPYGNRFTKLEELKEAATKLGLSGAHVDSATMQIRVGDLMLAFIPRAEAERRTDELLAANKQREDDAVDSYLASERRGIKPRVFESEEEYKDVRNHATRETNNRTGYAGRTAARNTR